MVRVSSTQFGWLNNLPNIVMAMDRAMAAVGLDQGVVAVILVTVVVPAHMG